MKNKLLTALSVLVLVTYHSADGYTQAIDPMMAWSTAKQVRPNMAAQELGFAKKILGDPRLRAQTVGHLGESVYVAEHPTYKPHPVKNHPQVDIIGRNDLTGQVKMFADGNPQRYWKAMLKDYSADRFLVPDDHLDALRKSIRNHIATLEARGQIEKAQDARRQLARLRPLGHTYEEYSTSLVRSARSVVTKGATQTGMTSGAFICIVDGAAVIYKSANGQLSPGQTVDTVIDTGAKALAVGSATAITVMLGANPVSLTVIVVGAGVYFVTDYTLARLHQKYSSGPLETETINRFIPLGWSISEDPKIYSHPES